MAKRRHFTAEQKAAIVLEVLKEEKHISQIASEHGVHPNQIQRWKRDALERFTSLFEDKSKEEQAEKARHEKQTNDLYAEIGRLTTQLNWLKKKSGLLSE